MPAVWHDLSADAQDLAILAALLSPLLLLGWGICRGYALMPLLRSLFLRHLWTNLAFIALVAISVGLGVGLIAQERGLRTATARVAEKFDLVIAAPGDEIGMLMATVFLQPSDAPLLDGQMWQRVAEAAKGSARIAPLAYGDSWQGHTLIGSTAEFVTHLSGDLAEGTAFTAPSQAVVGAGVPLRVGQGFAPAHGSSPAAEADAHDDMTVRVVGRMRATGSPWDSAIILPVEGVWLAHGLGNGHADAEDPQVGPPFAPQYFPGTPAILVTTRDLPTAYALQSRFDGDDSMAFFPGAVLSRLHGLMGNLREIMSVMSVVTQVIVLAAVTTGLIVLSRLFSRRLALLQALGAPARMIFALIWSYAALLLGIGAVLGLAVAFGAVHLLSAMLSARTGLLIAADLGWAELHLVAACLALGLLVALIPALVALRRDVTEALRR
ncbi:putative ABC transport system permease protein [Paracoccus isoporae]|uniref:Putative ABC transport system permease protein n=1 Tax=Paracoccus isoporae TaxID=591205 RepID=A0A1G6SYI0_9RHOB|nr:hypothetical protein [Paracoccus isoporae]SDD21813.1 putative ABC transport system permease protein [Paracoccus isoporae]